MTAPAVPRPKWRLTPGTLRALVRFLERLETDETVSSALIEAGYFARYSRAMALLAANRDRLQVGLLPPRRKVRP